uniref:Fumarylacetoacetase-like C-terminal domain-containing protein n=1 Tax=Mucochytrium quahogii TaxID=96639 RepID=A0A7S2S7B8_9STRA|mmetsp:Transcript_20690/g.34131  ORF Transcript_20690/g.34131 Transcript_20690/m.34131 type:complete len:361 (-) Transcript_20690:93-1175(-)|eukprot:CAMPEP_0203796640 /NCGR_PEP_ID=MMETSP0100_2-20121128/8081_1 /ASSEMBLY_ACC=CAM_ASM_000210 /TAXON_ID=96639 /ORGANISM=" , Strain NY0313808BC1" /LENGTH=360 /DNA_ID=CAMNT_0050701649 /DNA_START=22 /DNA_END=1104 /DNA_ORIENTATION=-
MLSICRGLNRGFGGWYRVANARYFSIERRSSYRDHAGENESFVLSTCLRNFSRGINPNNGVDAGVIIGGCRKAKVPRPFTIDRDVQDLLTVEQGYQLQQLVDNAVECNDKDWKPCGYKIGATNAAAQERMGLSSPFVAKLFSASTLVPMSKDVTETASLSTPVYLRGVEAEWAFIIGADLPSLSGDAVYSTEDVKNAVAAVVPSIEVLGTRFSHPVGTALAIADGGGNGFVVLPTKEQWRTPSDWECTSADEIKVSTYLDGKLKAEGSGANVLGHPLNALEWLVNHASRESLKAGDVVISGACNGIVPLSSDSPPSNIKIVFEGWTDLSLDLQHDTFVPFEVYLRRWANAPGNHHSEKNK